MACMPFVFHSLLGFFLDRYHPDMQHGPGRTLVCAEGPLRTHGDLLLPGKKRGAGGGLAVVEASERRFGKLWTSLAVVM